MSSTIVLLVHHEEPDDDLASLHLAKLGFNLKKVLPVFGDVLPRLLARQVDIAGIVIYGGEQNLTEIERYPFLQDEVEWLRKAMTLNIPVLGLCLGAQLIAYALGAKISAHETGQCEFGYYEIKPTAEADHWIEQSMTVPQAHFQQFDLPEGATLLAKGEAFANQAFRYKENIFGLQFHPEVNSVVFSRWQEAEWAFFSSLGAQTKDRQNHFKEQADKIVSPWFESFLEKLFVGAPINCTRHDY